LIERPVEVRLLAAEYLVTRLCAIAFNSLTDKEFRALVNEFREAILADLRPSQRGHREAACVADAVAELMQDARSFEAGLDG
jgi:hypothetical protein